MKTSNTTAILVASLLSLALAGCNSKPAVEASAGGATASVASADSQEAQPTVAASAPEAPAAASIGASAVEARAGDVSVKLPN